MLGPKETGETALPLGALTRVGGPRALAAAVGVEPLGLLLLVLPEAADGVEEGALDVGAVLGRGLDKAHAQLLGEVGALLGRDGAVGGEVALVGHEDDGQGNVGREALHLQHLPVELADPLKRSPRRDAVHQQVGVAVADPLLPQRRVLLLPGRVQHLEYARPVVHVALLAVAVLERGIILFIRPNE